MKRRSNEGAAAVRRERLRPAQPRGAGAAARTGAPAGRTKGGPCGPPFGYKLVVSRAV